MTDNTIVNTLSKNDRQYNCQNKKNDRQYNCQNKKNDRQYNCQNKKNDNTIVKIKRMTIQLSK